MTDFGLLKGPSAEITNQILRIFKFGWVQVPTSVPILSSFRRSDSAAINSIGYILIPAKY
jgi:hypothetical protein